MKTAELTGALLDYWVAKAEGFMRPRIEDGVCVVDMPDGHPMQPSTNWAQGGPIIERGRIAISPREPNTVCSEHYWAAMVTPNPNNLYNSGFWSVGPTTLIAAMRAKVDNVYGYEVPNATL